MQKIVIHAAGGYEQLKIEEAPELEVPEGSILVKTKASGVNYADVCVRWGVYESAKKYVGWPITPGFEFSGTVKKSRSPKFKEGDAVFGVTRFDAYASEVVVPEYQLFALPKSLSFEQAAGFPAVFLTAYHALNHHVVITPGMKALVHSAAGGVGSSLVQIGKIMGLEITAVVGSSHKVEYAKACGADHVIDKSKQDLWAEAKRCAPDGFDVCFDANGVETFKQSYSHLRPMGKLVVYGAHTLLPKSGGRINYLKAGWGLLRSPKFDPMQLVTDNKGVVGFNLSFLFDETKLFSQGLNQLIEWMEAGKLKPPHITTFPFEDVAKAHQAIESGKSIGKLVLTQKS